MGFWCNMLPLACILLLSTGQTKYWNWGHSSKDQDSEQKHSCVKIHAADLHMYFCNYWDQQPTVYTWKMRKHHTSDNKTMQIHMPCCKKAWFLRLYSDLKCQLSCIFQPQRLSCSKPWVWGKGNNGRDANRKGFTCRLMKLDVVSEDVLPSERLKRLLRLGNFLGSCDDRDKNRY